MGSFVLTPDQKEIVREEMEDPAFHDTVGRIMDAVRECDEEPEGDPPMCECSMFLAYHLYCAYEWQPTNTEGDDGND